MLLRLGDLKQITFQENNLRKYIKSIKIYLSSKQAELAAISDDVSENSDKIHLVANNITSKIHSVADNVANNIVDIENIKVTSVSSKIEPL